jgi:hypothetical protein
MTFSTLCLSDKVALRRKEDTMAISIKGDWKSFIKGVSGFETFEVNNEPDSNGKFTGTYHFKSGISSPILNGKYKSNTPPSLDHMSFEATDGTGKKVKHTFNGDLTTVGSDVETKNGKHHKDNLPLTKKKKGLDDDDDWLGTHTT